jgi:hypothetical protein
LNVRRILLDDSARGISTRLDELDLPRFTHLHQLEWFDFMRLMAELEAVFPVWSASALDLDAEGTLAPDNIGARVSFSTRFYTKNVPKVNKDGPYELAGVIEEDPHLWARVGVRKVYVRLDPRWFTTDTAWSNFTSGQGRFAGVGVLANVLDETALIAPYVIAVPRPPWLREWDERTRAGVASGSPA